ncbi:TcaA NTF2-like domain-containing protein [Macrococcus carouselicus]|uniref:TcaA protein NTF2-like domain-containing protein n=1 Tax=Macrococcus carouselicus TaxID=69969 RepID=A0A9Q8CEJ2_9STAP|nr:hypothetical protein [Macrococcus carouselicus]TDM00807.1 hypothetical protein ERX40_08325 [Macrococcus carouselicus]
MKKIISLGLAALILTACSSAEPSSSQRQVDKEKVTSEQAATYNEKKKTEASAETPTTETPENERAETEMPTTEATVTEDADKVRKHKDQSEESATEKESSSETVEPASLEADNSKVQSSRYAEISKKQLSAYFSTMPTAFNHRDLNPLRPYVQTDSEAEQYLRNKLPAGQFDNYEIESFSIDQVKIDKSKSHVTATRIMTSAATDGQWKKVVTVYDMVYSPTKNTMLIYDFNDKVIYDFDKALENALRAVKEKYAVHDEKEAGSKVSFVKADPAVEEDAGGVYYRFKSTDSAQNVIHSYKYYQKNGQIVVE